MHLLFSAITILNLRLLVSLLLVSCQYLVLAFCDAAKSLAFKVDTTFINLYRPLPRFGARYIRAYMGDNFFYHLVLAFVQVEHSP